MQAYDTLPSPAALSLGSLAYKNGEGFYQVVAASSPTATLAVTTWTPAQYRTQNRIYGFDLRDNSAHPYGARPSGFPDRLNASVDAMYTDSDHRIWLVADAGVFAHQGITIVIGSRTWNLQYSQTSAGQDQFFSGTTTTAPWTTGAVTFTIHALGGKTPFRSTTKQWSLVDPIPTPVAHWAVAGQPEPDRRPTGVTALPERFTVGQRIVLLNSVEYQPYYTIHPDAIIRGVTGDDDIGGTGWGLRRYTTRAAQTNLHNRLVLQKPASADSPTHITIDGMRYECNQVSTQNLFFVARYTATNFSIDRAYNVWWETADANHPAKATYPPGDYTADTETSLIITPGSTAAWAQDGNADKIPSSKIPTPGYSPLIDGAGVGLTASNSTNDVIGGLQLLSPTFDLDDSDKQDGFVDFEATLAMTAKSDDSMGFGADAELTARIQGIASASSLRASTDYASAQTNGVKIGSVDVYKGAATKLGTLSFYLAQNASHQLGYWLHYDGLTGSDNFTVSLRLFGAYVHQLAPTASGGARIINLLKLTYTSGAFTQAWQPQRYGCRVTVTTNRDSNISVHFSMPNTIDATVLGLRISHRYATSGEVQTAFIPRGSEQPALLGSIRISVNGGGAPPWITHTLTYLSTYASGSSLEYDLVAV